MPMTPFKNYLDATETSILSTTGPTVNNIVFVHYFTGDIIVMIDKSAPLTSGRGGRKPR